MKKRSVNLKTSNSLKNVFICLVLILGFFYQGISQETAKTIYVEIKLAEGAKVVGELVEDQDEQLIIISPSMGEITISKSKIKSYKMLPPGNIRDGVYWPETTNASRNIYAPTGYGLKKGEGYYQNFMLVWNQFSYGITDNFSMGVNFEIASILSNANSFSESEGGSSPGFMLTPKFSYPVQKDKWNIGVGAAILHLPGSDKLFDGGILYTVSTWGSKENNFTIGLGMGIADKKIHPNPIITVAGTSRVSRRFALISESWFSKFEDTTVGIGTFGGRILADRVSIDIALVVIGAEGEFLVSPIPLVGLVVPFGKGWKE